MNFDFVSITVFNFVNKERILNNEMIELLYLDG